MMIHESNLLDSNIDSRQNPMWGMGIHGPRQNISSKLKFERGFVA